MQIASCFRIDLLRRVPSLAVLAVGLLLVPAQQAAADDESDETEVRVQAPLEAVSCSTDPNLPTDTIQVLGLTVDVTNANIRFRSERGCEVLVVGQNVKTRLVNATAPLVATRVDQDPSKGQGQGHHKVQLQAPLEAVDTTALTIQILGLTIDISGAQIEADDDDECDDSAAFSAGRVRADEDGDDEDDDDDGCAPADPNQLMAGQFVEVRLDP